VCSTSACRNADGLSVLADLRQRGNPLPVLILTARDSSADKIAGLDAGADDYLTKPFDLPNCRPACGP
jgi:DNA-binding response OmpR family regulator